MSDEPWHLDKRVPVALIITLISQFAFTVWLASAMSSDIEALQINDTRQDTMIEGIRLAANAQAVQLGRIEEISLNTQRAIEHLTDQLDARP